MAKMISPPADVTLYEEDFYLWVERQAELLRQGRFRELDLRSSPAGAGGTAWANSGTILSLRSRPA
jgi:hypothetical protein